MSKLTPSLSCLITLISALSGAEVLAQGSGKAQPQVLALGLFGTANYTLAPFRDAGSPLTGLDMVSAPAAQASFTGQVLRNAFSYTSARQGGWLARLQYDGALSNPTEALSPRLSGGVWTGVADYQAPSYGFSIGLQRRQVGSSPGLNIAEAFGQDKDTVIFSARLASGALNFDASLMRRAYSPASWYQNSVVGTGVNAYQLGVSYALSPQWVAGASYMATSADSYGIKLQARYAYSPATTWYVQLNHVDNSALAGRPSGAIGNFFSINAPGFSPDASRAGSLGLSPSAIGVGVNYRF